MRKCRAELEIVKVDLAEIDDESVALREKVAELERELMESYDDNRTLRARERERDDF